METTPTPNAATTTAAETPETQSLSYYVTIDKYTSDCKIALTNGQLPEILPHLEKCGYPKTVLVEKLAECEELIMLNEKQKQEYGEAHQAVDNYTVQRNLLHDEYIAHLGLARIALKKNVAAQTGLGLKGKRKTDEAGYCAQALLFYNGVLANDDYKTALKNKGIDEPELVEIRDKFKDLSVLAAAIAREGGEAGRATALRNQAYDTFSEWFSEFKDTAIITLRKYPQLRELMGWKEESPSLN